VNQQSVVGCQDYPTTTLSKLTSVGATGWSPWAYSGQYPYHGIKALAGGKLLNEQ
jgi:hypothetical protein